MSATITPLHPRVRSVESVRDWLAEQGDAKSVVVIVMRQDNTFEVMWSRQELRDLGYSALRLEQEVRWLMDGRTELDDGTER